ncbi:guanine nucleotide-binding protein-like 1 [Lineus longissimus]|uniref:guanine nucleotide-binding protein-like 1 n=1 Tax=Lineus longissimus TaxID=88925 RepID=UPI002B4CDBC4
MPRKKPFSSKQKKKQLQEKREKQAKRKEGCYGKARYREDQTSSPESSEDEDETDVKKINQQPTKSQDRKYDPNRYRLHFAHETRKEIEKRKELARHPVELLPESDLEIDLDEIYQPGTILDMPKRPPWNHSLTKGVLESREEKYFRDYLDSIMDKYPPEELSYFEINLETWRQLWRVLEISDIILLITDIRHPALHFSPALYDYVTNDLKKHIILVLNKIDLAPPPLVVAWRHYFQTKFPKVHIVCFTSFPRNIEGSDTTHEDPGNVLRKKRKIRRYNAVGPLQLLKACETICLDKVDMSSWKEKIETDHHESEVGEADIEIEVYTDTAEYREHVAYRDGVVTIGCVGYPNVGKSSLMNGLVGKKVVSTSRTPGHTKHFQTIFLTKTVKLCDSPGLVFPSLVQKPLQIIAGIYPIAQVREPYSAVSFLTQRLSLPKLLVLKHPDEEAPSRFEEQKWSAFDVCEAWAEKRSFVTARARRNDTYRAANNILRLAVEGRLCLCMRPPGYTNNKSDWENHAETLLIAEWQQNSNRRSSDIQDEQTDESESDDDGQQGASDGDDEGPSGLATKNAFDLLADDDD